MRWQPPTFIEVDMNAEIGAYQDDFDERPSDPGGPDRVRAALLDADSGMEVEP